MFVLKHTRNGKVVVRSHRKTLALINQRKWNRPMVGFKQRAHSTRPRFNLAHVYFSSYCHYSYEPYTSCNILICCDRIHTSYLWRNCDTYTVIIENMCHYTSLMASLLAVSLFRDFMWRHLVAYAPHYIGGLGMNQSAAWPSCPFQETHQLDLRQCVVGRVFWRVARAGTRGLSIDHFFSSDHCSWGGLLVFWRPYGLWRKRCGEVTAVATLYLRP